MVRSAVRRKGWQHEPWKHCNTYSMVQGIQNSWRQTTLPLWGNMKLSLKSGDWWPTSFESVQVTCHDLQLQSHNWNSSCTGVWAAIFQCLSEHFCEPLSSSKLEIQLGIAHYYGICRRYCILMT